MTKTPLLRLLNIILLVAVSAGFLFAQAGSAKNDEKAEAILAKAVQNLGGDHYVKATSQYGRGKFSVIKDGAVASFQTFSDLIVDPNKERNEVQGGGTKSVL